MIRAALLALACLSAVPAAAGDLRSMMKQPGEWEASISGDFIPPTHQKGCYAGDKTVADLTTKSFKQCGEKSVTMGTGTATVDAVCRFKGVQVAVHGTVTAVGNNALHSESQITLDGMPGVQGLPGMTVTMDARRTGPCQPGEKPM